MAKENILITVKTYPTVSTKYRETVCTAGIRENGSWARIYPIKFRNLPHKDQYEKYVWVEADIVKDPKDFRQESYRLISTDNPPRVISGRIPTSDNWRERKRIVLNEVYYDISDLIQKAHDTDIYKSLAVFKPKSIIGLHVEQADRKWSQKQQSILRQQNLFESPTKKQPVTKLPFKFKYVFTDVNDRECAMSILDWEIGALYWNELRSHGGDEKLACEGVRNKYLNQFGSSEYDLHFFLGTTKDWHLRSENPFTIVGIFYPKHDDRLQLF